MEIHTHFLSPHVPGRLLSAKFNLVPVPELAKAPLCTNLIVLYSASSTQGARAWRREKKKKKKSTKWKYVLPLFRKKNVYNIIKVIPDSFHCLHYASIQLGTVHLQTDHVIFTMPSLLSTKSNRRLFSFILLRPAIMAVGCCYFISILY